MLAIEQEIGQVEWDTGMDTMIQRNLETHQKACHIFPDRMIYSAHVAMPTKSLFIKSTANATEQTAKESKTTSKKEKEKLKKQAKRLPRRNTLL
jgi:hypothetical protein